MVATFGGASRCPDPTQIQARSTIETSISHQPFLLKYMPTISLGNSFSSLGGEVAFMTTQMIMSLGEVHDHRRKDDD
jgi:hypothetical protein